MDTEQATQPLSEIKNPLTSWAWTFFIFTIIFNILLIKSGNYRWYYFMGDIATVWFIVLWAIRSDSAAKVLLVTSTFSFAAYHMAYLINVLKRPTPLWWCISFGLGFWGLVSIWRIQKDYLRYLSTLRGQNDISPNA
jgi:predicted neutral ceramidase superfamily lipid hydrolase